MKQMPRPSLQGGSLLAWVLSVLLFNFREEALTLPLHSCPGSSCYYPGVSHTSQGSGPHESSCHKGSSLKVAPLWSAFVQWMHQVFILYFLPETKLSQHPYLQPKETAGEKPQPLPAGQPGQPAPCAPRTGSYVLIHIQTRMLFFFTKAKK